MANEMHTVAQTWAALPSNDIQLATSRVLYHQEPVNGDPFIQIREWVSVNGDRYDLIAEWGRIQDDELITACHVLPGFWNVANAVAYANEQLAHWPA